MPCSSGSTHASSLGGQSWGKSLTFFRERRDPGWNAQTLILTREPGQPLRSPARSSEPTPPFPKGNATSLVESHQSSPKHVHSHRLSCLQGAAQAPFPPLPPSFSCSTVNGAEMGIRAALTEGENTKEQTGGGGALRELGRTTPWSQ